MPRTVTAGQRTVGDMTRTLERAGYDTSNLKAHVIAVKAIASKRKRAQNADDGMDVDTYEHDGWEDDAMDVDGEITAASKRAKNNSGGVAARSKLPQSNRQIAGLRNAEVGGHPWCPGSLSYIGLHVDQQATKAFKLRNLSQRERNYNARAGESDRAITTKMVRGTFGFLNLPCLTLRPRSRNISSRASANQGKPTADDCNSLIRHSQG